MARTWTLLATLSLTANLGSVSSNNRAMVNSAGNVVYFNAGVDFISRRKIYKWDGTTLTDIAGTTFDESGAAGVLDVCLFNDELFAGYTPFTPSPMNPATIYKYSGSGTTWTLDYTLPDEAAGVYGSIIIDGSASEACVYQMDADDTYMAVVGKSQSPTGPGIMFMRTTGGTWSLSQMPGSVYPEPQPFLVGLSKGSQYGKLICLNLPGASNYRTVERGSPTPWVNLAGSNIGDKRLIGYADGKSFFVVNVGGSTWELKYSTDWGVNLVAAGGLTQTTASQKAVWNFLDAGDGDIMLAKKTDQAYTWQPVTDTFVTDGTVGSGRAIQAYFRLSGLICALCTTGVANEAEVWAAQRTVQFYQGIGSLSLKSSIPVAGVDPGGLAVSLADPGVAWVGSAGPSAQMVVRAASPWSSWTDLTGDIPAGGAVRGVRRVPYEVKG